MQSETRMTQLRDYQLEAIAEVSRKLLDNPILVLPTGGGKTYAATELIKQLGMKTLWIAHRRELIAQAAARLTQSGLSVGVIQAGFPERRSCQVQVASVQTLVRRTMPPAQLVIIDECFPAGTLVDGRPIETIAVGDRVSSLDVASMRLVQREVTYVFRSVPSMLLRVRYGSHSVICTPGHPLLTLRGWVPAINLMPGDEVLRYDDQSQEVRCVPDGVQASIMELDDDADLLAGVQTGPEGRATETCHHAVPHLRNRSRLRGDDWIEMGAHRAGVVLAGVSGGIHATREFGDDDGHESETRVRKDDHAQSDEAPGDSREGEQRAKSQGVGTADEGRQRPRTECCSVSARREIGVADRSRDPDASSEGIGLPNVLQGRHREPRRDDRDRRRWKQSLQRVSSGAGSEEGRCLAWTRVDGVEILKQGGDGTFGGLCPDGHVYNLEVAEHENYTANGVVVHNCHHARATTYRRVLENYPGCPVVGLTATPFRLDGRGLSDVGFRAIVVAAWPDELIERDVLVEPTVYAPDVPSMQGVRRHHGDYSEAGLSMVMDRPQLVGNIVSTWQRLAGGRRTVVFAIDVAHSRHIVDQFVRAGVKAEHLDGSTSPAQRDATLHRLKIGYTTVVSQCAVLSEGWDMPALEVAVLARPTASLCVHLQQIGRICRAAPDKTGALVLDHAGNHLRLGPMSQRVDYSLDDVPSQARDTGESSPARMKRCPKCLLLSPPSAEQCVCGHTFQSTQRKIKHADGELQEYSRPNKQREDVPFELQQQAWSALQEQREHWGYLPGWAMHRFKSRFGFWPIVVSGHLVDSKTAGRQSRALRLAELMQRAREKSYKPNWAKVMYKMEFGAWPSSELVREAELLAQQVAP